MAKQAITGARRSEVFWVEAGRLVDPGPGHHSGLYQESRHKQKPRAEHVALLKDLGWIPHRLIVVRKMIDDQGKEELVIVDGRSLHSAVLYVNANGGGPGGEPILCLCMVERNDEAGYLATSLAANEGQRPLGPVERARGFLAILKTGSVTEARLAARHSMKVGQIRELLKVLELAPEVRDRVEAGSLPVSATRDLVKLSPAQQIAKLATLPEEPTVLQVRDAVKRSRGEKVTTRPPTSEVRKVWEAMRSGVEHSLLSIAALGYALGEEVKPDDRKEIDRLLALQAERKEKAGKDAA